MRRICSYTYGVMAEPALAMIGKQEHLCLYSLASLSILSSSSEAFEAKSVKEVGNGRLWVLALEGAGSGVCVLMKYIDTTMMKRIDLDLAGIDNSNSSKPNLT